jgi:hypothetical protein
MMAVQEQDTIEVVSNKVGEPHRRGVVQRILDDDPLRCEVEWEDGHTSELIPTGGNVRVVPPSR